MTRARIWGATVFVDYASRWVKVHIMQDATGESTLESKNAFERDCMTRNVVPKHYHVDMDKLIAARGGTNHPPRQPAVLFEVQTLLSPGSELA